MPYGKVWGRVWKGPQLTHIILLCLFWKFQKKSLSLPSENRESNMLDRAQTIEKLRSTRQYLREHYGARNDQKEGSDVVMFSNIKFRNMELRPTEDLAMDYETLKNIDTAVTRM